MIKLQSMQSYSIELVKKEVKFPWSKHKDFTMSAQLRIKRTGRN